MRPEQHASWEEDPAPDWDRAGVWQRIAAQRARQRRRLARRRLGLAAGFLLLLAAGGVGWSVLIPTPVPSGPGEVLPMMKDRVLDDSIVPEGDSIQRALPAPRPAGLPD